MGKENNLHEERFRKFMNYLKEHKAEIKVVEGGYTKTYYCSGQKNENKLKHLLEIALNVDERIAYNYTRPAKGLSDAHTNRVNISKIRNFIDSIQYYSVQEQLDEQHNKYLHPDKKWGLFDKPPQGKGNYQNPNTPISIDDSEYESIDEYFNSLFLGKYLKELSEIEVGFEQPELFAYEIDYYPFNHIVDSTYFYNHALALSLKDFSNSTKEVKHALTIYKQIELENKREGLIELIPGYKDYYFPTLQGEGAIRYSKDFKKMYSDKPWSEIPMEILIRNRYQLLRAISENELSFMLKFEERDVLVLYILLLITQKEFSKLTHVINNLCQNLIDELRFIVISSSNESGSNYQQHDIDLDNLSEILADFNFEDHLFNTFILGRLNILSYRMKRLPNSELVVNNFSVHEIKEWLNEQFEYYFRYRIITDLRIQQ